MQHRASRLRARVASRSALRTPDFPRLHPPRAADGDRHHGDPRRHLPADPPGPEAQRQGGGHAAVARRGGPRPPACHQPAHHRLYGLPAHSTSGLAAWAGTNWGRVQPLAGQAAHRLRLCHLAQRGRSAGRAHIPAICRSWKTLPQGLTFLRQNSSAGLHDSRTQTLGDLCDSPRSPRDQQHPVSLRRTIP